MKKLLILFVLIFTVVSCNNDDDATNQNTCNYQGFSYFDNNNNDQSIVAESELNTQYFPNASNGPFGAPGVEIASFSSSPTIFFTTNVIDLNEVGSGYFLLNGIEEVGVVVTCQRAGSAVGDEVRYDVVYGGVEVEFCVTIDEVL